MNLQKTGIPGLNITGALPRFNNSEDLYLRILSSFVKNAPTIIENINNAAKDLTSGKNIEAYRIAVHSIKGSSRGIGAEDLGNLAEKLEIAARQEDISYIETHTGSFIKAAQNLIAAMGAVLDTSVSN